MLHTVSARIEQRRSHVSKIGVSIFPSCLYKRSTTAVKRRRGERNWEEVSPSQPTRGYGERRKLPQRGLGQPQTILGRFMYNFMRFHASFGAFNSCLEMGDSYIPLLASRCDVTL